MIKNLNRTFNEIKELYCLGYEIIYNNYVKCGLNGDCHKLIVTKNGIKYTFILNGCYPFKPPCEIVCNDNKFENIYKVSSPRILYFLKKEYNIQCLCCYSLICKNNWTPQNKLTDIINEIKKVIKIKNNIIKLILFEKIKEKFKCYFFELSEYIDFHVDI